MKVLKVKNFMCEEVEKDGVLYTRENTLKKYGYTWKSTARGAVSVLSDEKGRQIFVPKQSMIDKNIRDL